jgi:hypothetical protein
MKKYRFLAFACCAFFVIQGKAQRIKISPNVPKAYKPWSNRGRRAVMVVKDHNHKPLNSPEAKNIIPSEDDCKSLPVVYVTPKDLQGPKGKNAPNLDYLIHQSGKQDFITRK